MTVIVTLTCDYTGCTERIDAPSSTLANARVNASVTGWSTHRTWHDEARRYTTQDYCPAHPQTQCGGHPPTCLTSPLPAERCETVPWRCTNRTMADLLGHDLLGHRITNILAQAGFTTREALENLEEAELLDMRGLGTHALVRIRHVLGRNE